MKPVDQQLVWIIIIVNVLLSTTADVVATIAWERRSWQHFTLMAFVSPFVYGTFGYVSSQFGLSITASIINSLVVIGPVTVGLIFRDEWKGMPWQVYVGMGLIIIGITLVVIFKPPK